MTNTSPQIFELSKPLPDAVLQPLKVVAATLEALGFRYFLVGATAREIILENVFGRAPGRSTRDLDFGVALSDWAQFEALRAALVKTGEFEPTSALQRILYLYSPGVKIKVDLIPFGGIEDAASSISWPPKKDVVMNVTGFSEALDSAILVRVEPDLVIPVTSLPGLIILKLFAWVDRKHENRDAPDILKILSEYVVAGNEDRLYEEEFALLEEVGFDVIHAGARLLGRDARFIARPETAAKLEEILTDEALKDELLNQMVQSGGRSDDAFAQQCGSLLENFTKGFLEKHERLG